MDAFEKNPFDDPAIKNIFDDPIFKDAFDGSAFEDNAIFEYFKKSFDELMSITDKADSV